jgi:prepilin-type N-terminal cleavage/methylation domain-containing protein
MYQRPQTSRPRRASKSVQGFSLLEVMISSALLLLAISGTLSGMGTAFKVYEHQRKTSNAIVIAESTIEDFLLRFRGDPQTRVGGEYGPHCYNLDGLFLKDASSSSCPAGTYYRATWRVDPTSLDGINKTTVFVRWFESTGEETITLFTVRN